MNYLGDRAVGSTVTFNFRTSVNGVSTTLSGSPVISVYKTGSTTESTAGVTLTADYDSRTGFNHVVIDTSADGTFYATGNDFSVVITTGTVGGISQVPEVVGEFSIGLSSASAPTVAQIASGVWKDTTAGDFTVAGSIGKDLFVGGIVPGGAGGHFIAGANAATSITTALTANIIGNITGNLSGSVGSVTAGVTLAASAVQAIWDALTSALTTVGSIGRLLVTNIDAAISSRMATYTQPTGFLAATFPSGTIANTTNITAGTITTVTNLTNAPTAGDFTATMKTSLNAATPASVAGAVGSVTGNVGGNVIGSVGSVVGLTPSNLDVTVSSRLAASSYVAPDNADIAAIAALTAATLDATVSSRATAASAASAVWATVLETGFTALQSMRLMMAILLGKVSGGATTTNTFRDVNDTVDRVTATVDSNGNRTSVTYNDA